MCESYVLYDFHKNSKSMHGKGYGISWIHQLKQSLKMKLYGFNNLTKTLSFNIYDICYTRTEEEKKAIYSIH